MAFSSYLAVGKRSSSGPCHRPHHEVTHSRAVCFTKARKQVREREKQSQPTYNITLGVTYHHLCQILFIGIKSLVLPTLSGGISSKDVSPRNWGP